MKPTSIVLLLVALIAGGLAAFLATQQSGPVQVVQGPTTVVQEAKEQVLHSQTYNFRDRKKRKGNFRQLWIQRINAAARANGMTYNRLIQGLGLAGVEVDRRILAELAVNEPATFAALVATAKAALPADVNAKVDAA